MTHYVHSRVLKINVGFLLGAGSGSHHETTFDVPTIRVADDLTLDYVRGPLRLSRTTSGILVQGNLEVGITGECYRCLDPVSKNVVITVEELFAYPDPRAAEFFIPDDANLDLAPLLRAEVLIATANSMLCKPDCKGLCPECSTNLNHMTCNCAIESVDPRLAGLRRFLE